jgi:hypothetical protein
MMRSLALRREGNATSMMPETIKLVFAVISHATFDTFSSVTLGGSSGASGDDKLGKIS